MQEIGPKGLTPVQYAVMQAVANAPGIDQRTLVNANNELSRAPSEAG